MTLKWYLLGGAAFCGLVATPAVAQSAPAAVAESGASASADAATIADIVVTGSRLAKNGNDAATPVSVVSEAEIAKAAPVTIADYVNQLPALSGSTTPRNPQSSVGAATGGANLLNLRSLGTNRTLVLVDGRRTAPTFLTGVVDINTLPTALVKRVDVVTGGASASYGSDAVGGVVNFILDTKFTGVKGEVQAGTSTRGDTESINLSLSAGTSFADGRGHFVISGSYAKQNPAFLDGRDWYKGYKIFANPAFVAGNGQPARLILPGTTLNTTDFGLIGAGPLKGTAFDQNGNVATTNFPFGPIQSGFFQSGGSANVQDNSLGHVVQLATALEQGTVFGRGSFDFSDKITGFVEGSYGKTTTSNQSGLFWRVGTVTVQADNAYLPASVKQAAAAAGVTSFPLSSNNRAIGIATGIYDRELIRVLGGFEGKIGTWSWNASYQYGRSASNNKVVQDIMPGRFNLAADAVVNPANGQIVCRSTLANPTNGCVPYNPLGQRALTAAQSAYLIGTSVQNLVYRQDVAQFSAQGPLFTLPAGDVSLAVGGEYRKEKADATSDALSQANVFYVGNYKPFTGSYNVKEAFAEVLVPVFKDSAIGRSLSFNGAVRLTDYSTSGSVTTWKAGLVYKPIDDLTFRVTRSRDIRAPNLSDLFQGGTFAQQTINNPFRANTNDQFSQITGGNPGLKPEIAKSLTLGVVYQPSWFPGFSASVDYYDIKIAGSIATLSAQLIVNQCFAGKTEFCSAITGDPKVDITAISVIPFNARTETARGVDFEMGYNRPVGRGQLSLRGLLNYAAELNIASPAGVITRAGELGTNLGAASGVPRFTGLLTAAYAQDPFTVQLKGRFISGGPVEQDYGPLDVNIERNHAPGIFYLDAFVGYDLKVGGGNVQLFVAAENLLDTDPPVVVSQDNTNTQTPGTNVSLYDVIGRTVRAGVRFKF